MLSETNSNVILVIPNPLLLPIEHLMSINPQARITLISKIDEIKDKDIIDTIMSFDSSERTKIRKIGQQDLNNYGEYIACDIDGGKKMLFAFKDNFDYDWTGIYSITSGFKNTIIGETLGRQALSISRELRYLSHINVKLTKRHKQQITEKYSNIRKEILSELKNDKYQRELSSIDSICFYCGIPIEKYSRTCPDCKKNVLLCTVCKLPISFGDSIGKCSLCETIGHLSHIQGWVKKQGRCPRCLREIPIEGIVPMKELPKK